jgi:hypothetical protein
MLEDIVKWRAGDRGYKSKLYELINIAPLAERRKLAKTFPKEYKVWSEWDERGDFEFMKYLKEKGIKVA